MTLRSCLFFLVSLLVVLAHGQVAVPNRWTDVVIAKRDYSGNLTASDRVWYWKNTPAGGGVCPSVEYDMNPGGTGQVGVVFKRGTASTTIAVTFRNWNTFALSGTLRFISAKLLEPDANGVEGGASAALSVSPTGVQSISLPANGGSQTFTITVSGLPSSVALGNLAINYDLPLHDSENNSGNNGTNGGFEGWERLYVVDGTPVGLQAAPWTDFLESTCRWAFGAVGQADMRDKMVKGMRYNRRSPLHLLYYNLNQLPFYIKDSAQNAPNRPLRLSRFVSDLRAWDNDPSNQTAVSMQCADWAAILNTAFRPKDTPLQQPPITRKRPM